MDDVGEEVSLDLSSCLCRGNNEYCFSFQLILSFDSDSFKF